jgi:RND family efflux transporter MFP subunit
MNPLNGAVMKSADQPLITSPTDVARASGGKLRRAAWVVAGLVLVGVLAGLLPRWHQRAALRNETQELAEPTVAVVTAVPGNPNASLPVPCEIRPYFEAPIYARASGYLKRWLVDIGAQVKEGDLLAEIDTPELNQELAQARAQLVQAQAALDLARITAARWAELLKTSSVSEQEAAEKQADFQLKQANVDAVKANVARLEELQRFQNVRAPFAGTITQRAIDIGQLITSGNGRELFRLAQTSVLRIYARVPEALARSIVPGQMAELSLPDLPNRSFAAKVVRTAGAMSADSRTLLTELQVDNANGQILSGTYAQVRFIDARPEPALTLPSNTLLFRAQGLQVGVVNVDGTVALHEVALGRDFGPTVEVLSGVTPTDRVILNPSDSLVSGMHVTVAGTTAKTLTEK